ncbi:TRAP transporter small permease subunit [Roseovarius indicus]|uniref:TRAP transporter small permease subunit n=1 Tax=Roseovarius indicus TaxID=540747 RepID=UPI0007D8D6B3|nr:TRAP transporter small permease [Roseovarius indicus]OAN98768.1 C4-dicarboxylate ABC transporter permease [Roseovarius indicus]
MAGASTVLEDGSLLSRLDKQLVKLERFFALLSGLAVFSLMFLAAYSVGGRKFFGSPMAGYVDWIEMLMPLIAFMGIAYVQRDGGHIRMDIVIGQLKGRALWAAELLSVLLILLLIVGLIWGSWAHFDRSFDFSRPLWSRDSTIDIGLPVWPSKILVPVAFSVLCLRLLIQIWAYGRALVLGLERPVAVPLIQSVAEQAASEADQLEGRD